MNLDWRMDEENRWLADTTVGRAVVRQAEDGWRYSLGAFSGVRDSFDAAKSAVVAAIGLAMLLKGQR